MAKTKIGTLASWCNATPLLTIFRLMSEEGSSFPEYKAGQYIALRRDDCLLTKKAVGAEGQRIYVPDLDTAGKQKCGPVTHSYSIASAPFETCTQGHLEFYVILEKDEHGAPGRLTESLFRMSVQDDNKLTYYNIITGNFTLDKCAVGFQNVVFIGTGTGAAPFVSMIKQLHHEASQGLSNAVKYTLLHTNRTREELDYYDALTAIERAGCLDFVYVPSLSRVSTSERADPALGKGRANNLLRHVFEMPLKEEQDLQEAAEQDGDVVKAQAILAKTTQPVLPQALSRDMLRQRMDPPHTVIITCGNSYSMADIKYIADANQIRFEKEDW